MKPKLLTTLVGYDFRSFARDAFAGVTVALIALPLSIAIAIGSGAPPAAGLATAVVGGFLISLLGGSKVQIGGPTGAFIVLVYAVIEKHGFDGLVLATLMAGMILMIAGPIGVGRVVEKVPEPVIDGFTIGIAIVIAVSQLKDLFGMSGPALDAEFLPKLQGLWAMRSSATVPAIAAGLLTLALIVVGRRVAPRAPGALLAIAAVSHCTTRLALPLQTLESV
jgi:sulfate permease, SulP family